MEPQSTSTPTAAELASLDAKFILPLMVSDLLSGREPLDDHNRFVIHSFLGEMTPVKALFTLGLCAQKLAQETDDMAIGEGLGLFARKIVHSQAHIWLDQKIGSPALQERLCKNTITQVAEDLEALHDHLLVLSNAVDDDVCAALCIDLSNEAHWHAEPLLVLEAAPRLKHNFDATRADGEPVYEEEEAALPDNVVAFPRARANA